MVCCSFMKLKMLLFQVINDTDGAGSMAQLVKCLLCNYKNLYLKDACNLHALGDGDMKIARYFSHQISSRFNEKPCLKKGI